MAEIRLDPTPTLGGARLEIGMNIIAERDDMALVSVATPLNGEAELGAALAQAWGLKIPAPALSETAGDMRAIRTSPDQMMLVFPHATPDAEPHVQKAISGKGYTTDQTDVWVVLEVSGPENIAALERLCPLDLPAAPTDFAARTVIEHMGAIVVKLADDRFLLMSASSSASSFLHAVETSYRYVT